MIETKSGNSPPMINDAAEAKAARNGLAWVH
ncbi:hypothetical protein AAKU52_003254 [Pedobacter sp. CG_S7]